MPVGRRSRDRLMVGTVLALRTDRTRLAAVAALTGPPATCTADILTADGKTTTLRAPYSHLPRWSTYVVEQGNLAATSPVLEQLRSLIARRRREAEQLASGPTMSRYEAAALASIRVQSIDKHRQAGSFGWAKRGSEVRIDRASFTRWLERRGQEVRGPDVEAE